MQHPQIEFHVFNLLLGGSEIKMYESSRLNKKILRCVSGYSI